MPNIPSFKGEVQKAVYEDLDLIKFAGSDDILATTKKVSDLNIFEKMINALNNFFTDKKFIEIKINDDELLVKISDIAKSLDISKEAIIKADEDGTLEKLISFGLEARHYDVDLSVFEDAEVNGNIQDLRYLGFLAESFHLPLRELLEAQQKGNLDEVFEQAREVERKTQQVFSKLDSLYSEFKDEIFTKDSEGHIITEMTEKELNSIKLVIRSAFKILSKNTSSTDKEMIIPVTKNHTLIAKSSRDSLELIGLFGKVLGQGGLGVAVQRINLLEVKFETGKESVVKIPNALDEDSAQIIQEAGILNKIHNKGNILGIQAPLKLVKNVFKGTSKHCHLGEMYESNLLTIVEKNKKLSLFEKYSIAFQLFSGLNHLHEMETTHGDIKLENIFFNSDLSEKPNVEKTRVFIGDFGGAIDHNGDEIPFQETVSDTYRMVSDDIASKKAYQEKDFSTYKDIEKKADVFAMSSSLCFFFTNDMPYNGLPGILKGYSLKDDLRQNLISEGLKESTADLILQGLSVDYKKRPDASVLLAAIRKDFEKLNPEKAKVILNLS